MQEISLEQLKDLLKMYTDRMDKTGEQVDWEYDEAAFPYTLEEKVEGSEKFLYLKGKDYLYNYLVVGLGTEETDGAVRHYIQVVLPDEEHRTPGDQSKGNEFAKYLGRYLKAELHLFNGRVMYFNPRK